MKELKRLREVLGLTQFDVAKKSGVERTRLSLAECGHVTLSRDEKDSIRRTLLRASAERQAQLKDVLDTAEETHVTV